MKLISLVVVLLVNGILCHNPTKPHGIQFLKPREKEGFKLELGELKTVLNRTEIAQRELVIVSIAGVLRSGKSFMLNFFLSYLYAQYKKVDITDWLGETNCENKTLEGFDWAGGTDSKTNGMWIWSEIFTHGSDDNGTAIILIDTQGIFDINISDKDSITIFAMSMMISSTLCFNVKTNIQKDDLKHLQDFAFYSKLAKKQTKSKAFQNLLFLVRDWTKNRNYGFEGGDLFVKEKLKENDKQPKDTRELLKDLDSSFEQIEAFLLPGPGYKVEHGEQKNVCDIDENFLNSTKELVSELFEPKKLKVKQIDGITIKARDFISYLNAYIDIFTGDNLPDPQVIYDANCIVHYSGSYKISVNLYDEMMTKRLNDNVKYFEDEEFVRLHDESRNLAIQKFQDNARPCTESMNREYESKIEDEIFRKLILFNQTNIDKRKQYITRTKQENSELIRRLQNDFEIQIRDHIANGSWNLNGDILMDLIQKSLEDTERVFELNKTGDADIYSSYLNQLQENIKLSTSKITKTWDIYNQCMAIYNKTMEKSIQNIATYIEDDKLSELNNSTQKNSKTKFTDEVMLRWKDIDADSFSLLQNRIEKDLNRFLPTFEDQNQEKRKSYENGAKKLYNEKVTSTISAFENKVSYEVENVTSNLNADHFDSFLEKSKEESIKEFIAVKKPDTDGIFNDSLSELKQLLDASQRDMTEMWKIYNESLSMYNVSMSMEISKVQSYLNDSKLNELDEGAKIKSKSKFNGNGKSQDSTGRPKESFQKRLEHDLKLFFDEHFSNLNSQQKENFKNTSNVHNKELCSNLKKEFEDSVRKGIVDMKLSMDKSKLESLLEEAKKNTTSTFDSKRTKDVILYDYTEDLEKNINAFRNDTNNIYEKYYNFLKGYSDHMMRAVSKSYLETVDLKTDHDGKMKSILDQFKPNLFQEVWEDLLKEKINEEYESVKEENEKHKDAWVLKYNQNITERLILKIENDLKNIEKNETLMKDNEQLESELKKIEDFVFGEFNRFKKDEKLQKPPTEDVLKSKIADILKIFRNKRAHNGSQAAFGSGAADRVAPFPTIGVIIVGISMLLVRI